MLTSSVWCEHAVGQVSLRTDVVFLYRDNVWKGMVSDVMERCFEDSDIGLRQWPDGSVLYARASGDTLFLDPLATAAFSLMSAGCAGESELCERLSRQLGIPDDDTLTHYIYSLLSRLRDLSLLAPHPALRTCPPACEAYGGSRVASSASPSPRLTNNEYANNSFLNNSVRLRIGRFVYSIAIRIPEAEQAFKALYAGFPMVDEGAAVDFHISLDPYRSLRRSWRRQAVFSCDGVARFGPFPRQEAMPYLEWGLNSCVARWSPYHLMLHAGTVTHAGRGMIMAGASGSGKSTLSAALMQRGGQLLSDEFALIRLSDGQLDPLVRPVCVKNEMIPRMKTAFPEAVFGPSSPGERKGIVAHMKPVADMVARMDEPVSLARFIFVQYEPRREVELVSIGKAEAMKRAVAHCFNYKRLGKQGFDLLADTIDRCACHVLTFGDAFDAAQLLEREFYHG